jgi:membrane associated rhomboid family serine protease
MIPIKDKNPTDIFPVVTILIIFANVMIFIFQLTQGAAKGNQLVLELGMIPKEITQMENLPKSEMVPPLLTIFTSMFLHGGFLHLIGNMLYLWIFGNNIEDAMGHFKFIAFYIICGLAATFAHILSAPSSAIPTIGASGAIAGILGAYLLLYPKARILTVIPIFYFIRIVELPAIVVLGFWFIIQVLRGMGGTATGGGVAWFAHIGGFVAGLALIKLFASKKEEETIEYF